MNTAEEKKDIADWKRAALKSVNEKLPLWSMLGIAHNALKKINALGDAQMVKISNTALREMLNIAKGYSLTQIETEFERDIDWSVERDIEKMDPELTLALRQIVRRSIDDSESVLKRDLTATSKKA